MAIQLENSARCTTDDWWALKNKGTQTFEVLLPFKICEGAQFDGGYYMRNDAWNWCVDNLKSPWYSGISFKPTLETTSQEDAALFKLFWL